MPPQSQASSRGKIIIGTFIDAPQPQQLRIRKNTVCVVNTFGFIESIEPFDQSESVFQGREEYDIIELGATQLMVPGLIDLHIHAPQYKQVCTCEIKHSSNPQKTCFSTYMKIVEVDHMLYSSKESCSIFFDIFMITVCGKS